MLSQSFAQPSLLLGDRALRVWQIQSDGYNWIGNPYALLEIFFPSK